MSDNVIQASFSSGELSPSLFARVDFAKYRAGAARMRNFFVDYRSGASTRPGTEFIRAARNTDKVRLVRFQQSTNVTFILEFGHGYLRFISNGSSVVFPGQAITGVTRGTQTTITTALGGFQNGMLLFISGTNIPQLNNRYFIISGSGASFVLLNDVTGLDVDSSSWPAFTTSAVNSAQQVFQIATPYTANQLRLLKFSQNASIMNITHPEHPPYKLQLFSALNWSLAPATFGATVGAPTIFQISSSTTGAVQYKYAVTAVDKDGQESPVGNVVILTGVADLRSTAGNNHMTWNTVSGAVSYNIYGSNPNYTGLNADTSGIGFIGSVPAAANFFDDPNIAPDFSQTPPIHQNPFAGVNPQVSSYFQQRLVYANGGGQLIQTFWMSKVGAPYNFDDSNPIQANDAFDGALVSLEVNEIKSLIPMPTGIIMMTTHGAWIVNGGAGGVATQGGPITPATATATPQAYIGANDVPPIVVNYDIIYVQAKGSVVRDLTFNIYANIYTGNDISILSSHLFYDHQVVEWAFAEEPFKVVWVVRDDGELLSLTLVKEQEMYGWARHDTRGNFESVATVTEGQFDATYVAVRRPNPANPNESVLMIERMADRTFPFGAEDAWCVDCGLKSFSNQPSEFLTIVKDVGDTVKLQVDVPIFVAAQPGWIVRAGGGIIEVTSKTSTQELIGRVIQPITDLVPDDTLKRYKVQDPGSWAIDEPFDIVYGLDHLEGQQVAVLADGGVVNGLTVTNGSLTLPAFVTKVIVGYGYQAQLQTMYLDLGQEANSIQGKRKKVGALTVRCKDSRGLKAGMTFETVTPIKELNRTTLMGLPIKLITADERIVMDPLWDVPGQICLQEDDPLPATVLGVIPEVVIGDSQK